MQMYKEFADIQTADMLKLPVPKIETGNAPFPQLYDMQAEKYETHNCAAEQPEEVFKMQTILRKERAR